MKKILFILLAVMALAGCTQNTPQSENTKVNENTGITEKKDSEIQNMPDANTETGTADTGNSMQEQDTNSDSQENTENMEPTATEIPPQIKEFYITAKNWEFIPSEITVNKNDLVKLTIKSIDSDHGFFIPQFEVNEHLFPGKETFVEFTADQTGTFTFSCNVFCGSGHGQMKETLIVK